MYIIRASSGAASSALHAETAQKALEMAAPLQGRGSEVWIEKDGERFSVDELERIVRSVRFGDDT